MDPTGHTFIAGQRGSFDTAHTLRGEGHDASEDGTGRGTPLVYMPARTFGADGGIDERFAERDVCDAVHTGTGAGNKAPIVFANTGGATALGLSKEGAPPVTTRHGDPGSTLTRQGVRRLTPEEAEALQGFPRGYTAIQYKGKPAKDGPRYTAIGNSMAVPVIAWIGRRIQTVDGIK
jgi:DNA (cytosine-5)-methyltransferase 1